MPAPRPVPTASLVLERLRAPGPLAAVEFRPPRSGLSATASMDIWIDMHHAVGRLLRRDTVLFLTDNAVGQAEEENLGHLTANLAGELDPRLVVPFLTCKHQLDYCLLHATRAASMGFEALTVLGGDHTAGPGRCLPHAHQLRQRIRARVPALALGGWANPHRDPAQQVDYLLAQDFTSEFVLTQIVSHHSLPAVTRFLAEADRRGVRLPLVFGVFLYRSANPGTLARLADYFPVPAQQLAGEFAGGMTPEEICARTVRRLREAGAEKIYLSNLGVAGAAERYQRILDLAEA